MLKNELNVSHLSRKMLYLFHISQNVNNNYDTYSDAIVVSDTIENAKLIHPDGNTFKATEMRNGKYLWSSWCYDLTEVECELIGQLTNEKFKAGDVVCASFHAG